MFDFFTYFIYLTLLTIMILLTYKGTTAPEVNIDALYDKKKPPINYKYFLSLIII